MRTLSPADLSIRNGHDLTPAKNYHRTLMQLTTILALAPQILQAGILAAVGAGAGPAPASAPLAPLQQLPHFPQRYLGAGGRPLKTDDESTPGRFPPTRRSLHRFEVSDSAILLNLHLW